ncbi:hypothetical protein I8J29_03600 [Paenibacillus sp. MWE-103]|uniref:Uncharacterized protein n=1 Tax=Paenibacillus artemisiicola TaxID=1172618 RepID=A0ABS3W4M8_9BACL|nr:hypothetical protein [Paenibacillus artemisiicola]MBO7743265.1 hypothetical protein [Paenibacillus artemisiicola]
MHGWFSFKKHDYEVRSVIAAKDLDLRDVSLTVKRCRRCRSIGYDLNA